MGVERGRLGPRVPQELLDRAEVVGPGVRPGGEPVTQRVTGHPYEPREHLPDRAGRDVVAGLLAGEHVGAVRVRGKP